MPRMRHNHIICVQDDSYTVVGPFMSEDALVKWGFRWQQDNNDDPRWQSLYLADANTAPTVIVPTAEQNGV